MARELRWCENVFGTACKGGSPFRDAAPSEERNVVRNDIGEGKLKYQLHLPELGKGALSLG
ncbi:hypothetical protein BDZ45DRAFT_682361 [Acephala macrosclerotiorum]|nr:hypothetical protein BDZ45DRAFT_682361 [Acephala macrosclerotiorum]